MSLRIVFLGTPEFSVAVLDRIRSAGFNVVAVVTMPDKSAGRGLQLIQSPVKQYALKNSLPCLQPTNLKSPEFLQDLKKLGPDIQVVVAFRMLPEMVWNFPPLGTYNLHASLLPHYRGAAPINWAIINGEVETGVTTFKLQHEIDTGSILLQEAVSIAPEMNAGQLHDLLMNKGADLMVRSLKLIEEGKINLRAQNDRIGSETLKHAPKIFKEDCRINFSWKASNIINFIRGLSPYPSAWTILRQNERDPLLVKIFNAASTGKKSSDSPGKIYCNAKDSLEIVCGDELISILEIQIQGKKRMNIKELLNGFTFSSSDFFEC